MDSVRDLIAATEWLAGTGEVDGKFVTIPSELDRDSDAAYLHITSNNTIAGTQFHSFPDAGDTPLVADMSSDIMWRPMDVSKFKLIYAGAQKNIGPSGLALIIVDKSWLEDASTSIPNYFRFKTHADKGSLYNTPPTFAIYLMRNVLRTVADAGGLDAMETRNREKARLVYDAIDSSGGFYRSPIETAHRSTMNVVFRLPSEELEKKFVADAAAANMIGLKGHRSVGGCRASIYNAVTVEGAGLLAEFMASFAKDNG